MDNVNETEKTDNRTGFELLASSKNPVRQAWLLYSNRVTIADSRGLKSAAIFSYRDLEAYCFRDLITQRSKAFINHEWADHPGGDLRVELRLAKVKLNKMRDNLYWLKDIFNAIDKKQIRATAQEIDELGKAGTRLEFTIKKNTAIFNEKYDRLTKAERKALFSRD